jgi:hypothetical protein
MKDIFSKININELTRIADTYIPYVEGDGIISYQSILDEKHKKISSDILKIPILGLQGAGKSSLINALLFDDIVLPVDGDEVTCIPTEVIYNENLVLSVSIIFNNGERKYLDDYKELVEYVNCNNNPGNIKGVEKAIVESNNILLKNDIVLVDLPGVGSLTRENEKITLKYLEKMSYAIILLNTDPPILRSESIIIKSIWSKLVEALFVQNRWSDNSDRDSNDAYEHNINVLKSIALDKKTNPEVKISVVNVQEALDGKIENNTEQIQNSGINDIIEFLQYLGNNWKQFLIELFNDYVKNLITIIKKTINENKEEAKLTIEELKEIRLKQLEVSLFKLKENNKLITLINGKINNWESELNNYIVNKSREGKENLRNSMRNVIKSGVVDGRNLARAFYDNQEVEVLNILEEYEMEFEKCQRDIEVDINGLEIKNFRGEYKKFTEFNKKEEFKFEKGVPYATGLAGSVAGIWAGAASAASIGTAAGTIFPGAGNIIGGIGGFLIGAGIGLIGIIIGKKTKELINVTRQNVTLKDLEEPLMIFEDNIRDMLKDRLSELMNHLKGGLKDLENIQKKAYELEKENYEKENSRNIEEKQKYKIQLQRDFENIMKIEEEYNA